jgi:cellobiose-specific phosphotransferase system component IIC
MESIAIVVAIAVGVCVAIFLPFFLSGDRQKAAEEKAHSRRIADAKMNARLLRFNL